MPHLNIRKMSAQDIMAVSHIHKEAFPRQALSVEWITCNYNAFPRITIFVAKIENTIVGYIQWSEKSGFRTEVVLELEQIAVLPAYQFQGIGTQLILQTVPFIQRELEKRQASVKHIIVSTRKDNAAQKLYAKTLKAKPEVIISNLFSSDEVFMLSRNYTVE